MSTSYVKQETVDYMDEDKSSCLSYMYPSKPFVPSEYVNQYDNKGYMLEQLKTESLDNGCTSQSHYSINNKMVSENKELLKLKDKQEIKHENRAERLSLNIKEEDEDVQYQFTLETHRLEQQGILNNGGHTAVHYDVLATPQEVQCKLCDKTFKNSVDLLKHNNEHVKHEANISGDSDTDKLYQCYYCDNYFDKYNKMLVHINEVHSEQKSNGESCGKPSKSEPNLKHQDNGGGTKEDEDIEYICDPCGGAFKSKRNLTAHIKRMHYDYGKVFECSCGKQFRTPMHLGVHKRKHHNLNIRKGSAEYKCKFCEVVFKHKKSLTRHVDIAHCHYGRTFVCWCGKQFQTPIHLEEHNKRRHERKNNVVEKFQCDFCHRFYKTKRCLVVHIKKYHKDSDNVYECWCGKQFRSKVQFDRHKSVKHVFEHEGFKFIFS